MELSVLLTVRNDMILFLLDDIQARANQIGKVQIYDLGSGSVIIFKDRLRRFLGKDDIQGFVSRDFIAFGDAVKRVAGFLREAERFGHSSLLEKIARETDASVSLAGCSPDAAHSPALTPVQGRGVDLSVKVCNSFEYIVLLCNTIVNRQLSIFGNSNLSFYGVLV